MIEDILNKETLSRDDIITLLKSEGDDMTKLFAKSLQVKTDTVGKNVYYRGLVEFSNMCEKDCYYCGIRKSNKNFERYNLSNEEIWDAAKFAYKENYGSVVLQAGELKSKGFTDRVETLLKGIKELSNNELGITISLGEQDRETYERWFAAGAHRYLLRIESSNKELYYKLHPENDKHEFEARIECLKLLKETGYQTGTGVMVGLPFQTYENLADDLLFMKDLDIDMCGMGPFIEHSDTPLYQYKDELMSLRDRFLLTLKMIATLRIIMPDINIAAATALQAIDPIGREKALKIGANIIMPNITPGMYRDDYSLYENKPCTDEEASDCKNCLEARITVAGSDIGYGKWGDSLHYKRRQTQQ
jgi:biotin synthase